MACKSFCDENANEVTTPWKKNIGFESLRGGPLDGLG